MAKHVVEEWYEENTWKCPVCNHEGNPGDTRKCGGCGRFKDAETHDVVPEADESKKITDPEKLKRAEADPDVVCAFCGSRTHRLDPKCKNCGARWDGTPEPVKEYKRPAPVIDNTKGPAYWDELNRRESKKADRNFLLLRLVMGAAAVAVLALLVWAIWPKEKHATVTGLQWTYTTNILHRVVRNGEGWGTRSGAYNISCERKYKEDEDCHPHDCNPYQEEYRCRPHNCNSHRVSYDCEPYNCRCEKSCTDQKNGYSRCTKSCDTCYKTCYRTEYDTCYDTCTRTKYHTCYDRCPVYDNWCRYNYDEWPLARTASTSGTTHEVNWPDLQPVGNDERMERHESYVVQFQNVKKSTDRWTYNPNSLSDFNRFEQDKVWVVKVTLGSFVNPQMPLTAEAEQ